MSTFEVKVGNATYEVDAADEQTAWKLANQTHNAQQQTQQTQQTQQQPQQLQQAPEPRDISLQGIMMGIKDPINAGAQFIARNVPPSVNEAIDVIPAQLRASNIPIVSKLANALLANPRPEAIDKEIRDREEAYQALRQQVGDEGFDTNRMVGNILPTAAATSALIPAKAVSTFPRLLGTSAVMGGASSQLTPAVTMGEQANYPEFKKGLAVTGTVLGPVGTTVGRMGGGVVRNIGERFSESSALDAAKLKLADVLSRSGRGNYFQGGGGDPLAQVEAKLMTQGPEATIAGAGGQASKSYLDLMATLPGRGKELVEQFIRNQQATRAKRLVTAADEALGTAGKPYTGTLDALVTEKQTISAPLYKQLEGVSVRVDDELSKLIQASKTAHGGAELLAELKRTTPIDISKIKTGDDIPFDALDKVKQALYDLAENSKGEFSKPTALSNAYNDLRIALTKKMDAISPQDKNGSIYKQARDAFGGPSELEGAVKAGRNAMKEDAIKVADATKGMGASEIEAYRIGVLQSLKDKVGTEGGQTSLLKMWKEPATSDKLKEIFGNDYRKFAADVAREARLKEIETVGRGAQTASRLMAAEDDALKNTLQAGQAVSSVTQGNPIQAIGTMAKLVSQASTPETTRNEIAKLLLQKGKVAQNTVRELPELVRLYNENLARQAAMANAIAQQPQR
jgi:hypothetical protein